MLPELGALTAISLVGGAYGLKSLYKSQRNKERRRVVYLLRELNPRIPVKRGGSLKLIQVIYGLGQVQTLLQTSRGRLVVLEAVKLVFPWLVALFRDDFNAKAINGLLPPSRDTPSRFIKSIFKPEIR